MTGREFHAAQRLLGLSDREMLDVIGWRDRRELRRMRREDAIPEHLAERVHEALAARGLSLPADRGAREG